MFVVYIRLKIPSFRKGIKCGISFATTCILEVNNMKKTTRITAILLVCALLLCGGVLAAGSTVVKTQTLTAYYSNISLVVDGVKITPKDANGTVVEPFIVDGTTYLPVRAIGEALGKQVSWDGDTRTVYVGEVPDTDTYLMDVCPPYQTKYYYAPEYFAMMGKNWFHGFYMGKGYDGLGTTPYVLINLNGVYETMEFDLGHVDGTNMSGTTFAIYLDGEYAMQLEATGDMMVEHITVPLHGALQMKILYEEYRPDASSYGFANIALK